MAKLTTAKYRSIAATRKRDASGQFAYDGGRKKPARKGRVRVNKDQLGSIGAALLALRSKKAPRQISADQIAGAKGLLGGLSDTKGKISREKLSEASKGLGRLSPKLTQGQRARILRASLSKPTPVAPTPSVPGVPKLPKGAKDAPFGVSDPKQTLPGDIVKLRAKQVVKRDSIQIDDNGIEIWRGSKYEKYDPSFKQRRNRKYDYSVEVDGKQVSLNKQWNVHEFQGEKVNGVPSLHPDLRKMSDESLARALVATMSQAESSSPSAPKWDPGLHGQVDGVKWTYDLGSKAGGKREGYYGEMQIHHVGQWGRTDFKKLQDDYEAGKYSPEEYRKIYDSVAYREKFTETKKGVSKDIDRLAIKVQDKGVREFVVLPAGLHDTNSSLFRANHHPMIYNPDTGKKERIGIPHKGKDPESGSREWFDSGFKSKFWKQVYQRESYVLRGEMMRRVKEGKLSPDAIKGHIDTAYASIPSE